MSELGERPHRGHVMNLMAREKAGEISDTILRKQATDDLVQLALDLIAEANKKYDLVIDRTDRIMAIAHDLAEQRGEHMGVDGI